MRQRNKTKDIEWVEARCPVCRLTYSYIKGGYKLPTCNRFTCLYKYLHSPQYRSKEVIEAKKKD